MFSSLHRLVRLTTRLHRPLPLSRTTHYSRPFSLSHLRFNSQTNHDNDSKWINILENTASAPWINQIPPLEPDRLKRSYVLLLQIILYLGRPQEGNETEQFLIAFESAPVSQTSEIHRARKSVCTITRSIVRDISSIPPSHSLRTEKKELFALFGALNALSDVYLTTEDLETDVGEWKDFWGRAQPVLIELGMKLDAEGFGVALEEQEKMTQADPEANSNDKTKT